MARLRFPFSSEDLEVLLAFEACDGLTQLSDHLAKDPSVISRRLQRIAEESARQRRPALVKVQGRWQLTPLGRSINEATRLYLSHLLKLSAPGASTEDPLPSYMSKTTALMILNAQIGLLDPSFGCRNNMEAERNIVKLLAKWREKNLPVIHVRHISENSASMFFRGSLGSEILPHLSPTADEIVFDKAKASAFSNQRVESELAERGIDTLILTGFTANECIDATARQAAELGFRVFVVSDATAMFDLQGLDGKLVKADRLHSLTMANLNALCATVLETAALLATES